MIIFQYHNVSKGLEFSMNRVTPRQFRNHLCSLLKSGLVPVSPLRFRSILKGEAQEGQFRQGKGVDSLKGALITFDDGLVDIFDLAFPLARSLGFKGIVFVVTGFIGKTNIWDATFGFPRRHLNLRELLTLKQAGWLIGSHSHTHPDLRKLSPSSLRREIRDSKKMLEDLLGDRVDFFSYPFGLSDLRVVEEVRESGYLGAFLSYRLERGLSSNPWTLRRIPSFLTDLSLSWKSDGFFLNRCLLEIQAGLAALGSRLTPLLRRKLDNLSSLTGIRFRD